MFIELGAVNVWNMESALHDKDAGVVEKSRRHLTLSSRVLDAAVRDVTWNGIFNPERLLVCGLDGQSKVIDTNDPFISLPLMRVRGIFSACGWAGHSSIFITVDADGNHRLQYFTVDGNVLGNKMSIVPGFCWTIATSEHHGQSVLGTSTGCVRTVNMYYYKQRGAVSS